MKLWKVLIVVFFLAFAGITCSGKGDGGDGGGGGAGGPGSSPVDQKVTDQEATPQDGTQVVLDGDNPASGSDDGGALVNDVVDDPANGDSGTTPISDDGNQGTGDTGQGTGDTGQGTGDTGQGTGDTGQGTGDTGQGTGDTGQGTGDTGQGTGDTGQGTGDGTQPIDDDADEPTGDCTGRSISLDSTYGKWFNTPEGVLIDADTWKDVKAQIKEKQNEIKELKKGKGDHANAIAALQKNIEKLQAEDKGKGKGQDNAIAALQANIEKLKAKDADVKAAIKKLRAEIKALQDKIGFAKKTGGIWTAWADQNLYLKVRNNCKPGWYKLVVVAKNIHGPLPDFYSRFNVTVRNETTGKYVGGIFVKASDKKYHRGRTLVYLPAGNTDLNLLWTNDAYQQGVYDANIQINKVVLKYAGEKAPVKGLKRNAFQYSFLEGTWYWDANTVRTYWANQVIGFDYSNLKPGKYEVIVTAKNYGKVPAGYTDFNVKVTTDEGASGVLKIKADADAFNKGKVVLDITGPTTVYLTWTNDKWVPDKGEDANIQIKNIRLKKVGESERSALAAYLIAKTAKNKFLVGGIFFSVAMVLGGLFAWNRKRMKIARA